MLNRVILVGRIEKIENNLIILKVFKHYKNDVGEYESMYIDVFFKGKIYSQVNDTIGIKGYLDITNNKLIVKAEKVTFLTSKGCEEK